MPSTKQSSEIKIVCPQQQHYRAISHHMFHLNLRPRSNQLITSKYDKYLRLTLRYRTKCPIISYTKSSIFKEEQN